MVDQLEPIAVAIDDDTVALYLEVPRSHVVLLTVFFELYDGVGTVRTLSGPDPIICVMTTNGLKEDCIGVLEAVRNDVHWEITNPPQGDPILPQN